MFHPERAVPETGVMRQRFWGNCFLFENLHVFCRWTRFDYVIYLLFLVHLYFPEKTFLPLALERPFGMKLSLKGVLLGGSCFDCGF